MSVSSTAAHRHFHDDLSELKAKLLTMSGEAQDALGRALDALLRRDGDLAARTIAGDHAVDALELEIEETVIDLLATQQPMARDLRLLVAATKIANDLERVGDHAVNIAQSAERLLKARLIARSPSCSRWPARHGRCSPARSTRSSGATPNWAARSAGAMIPWTPCTTRCSASCSLT